MLYLSVSFYLRNFHEYHEIMNEFHLQIIVTTSSGNFGVDRETLHGSSDGAAGSEKLWWLPGATDFSQKPLQDGAPVCLFVTGL